MGSEALKVGLVSVLFLEEGSNVSHAVFTLALQVPLELRSSYLHFTNAEIISGTAKTSEDSTSH